MDFVAKQVDGAIKFAKGIADKLGAFVSLVSDVAENPGQWVSNLGAAVVDGIKNHLWSAFKSAVSTWFEGKVQGLLSVGATVWKLVTGELGFSEIAKMAWGAIQAMIPPTLVRILVEKLVAMIVPAAGALMVIIEGIQAAWGTISQIIQALETFIAFLKAVKGGGAGPKFAAALAQAAIVVLDFVANFLLLKLGKGLKALAGKLKGIARRLMKKRRGMKAKKRRGPSRETKNNKKPKGKKKSKDKKKEKLVSVPIPDGSFGGSESFSVDRQGHRVLSKPGGIEVRSTPMSLNAFLRTFSSDPAYKGSKSDISAARSAGARALKKVRELKRLKDQKVPESKKKAHSRKIRKKDSALEKDLKTIRAALSRITGRVQINTARFWPNGRPAWRSSTKNILAKRWPNLHDPVGSTTLRPGLDRRHIEAFSTIRKGYQADLQGIPLADGVTYLARKGEKPAQPKNKLIEASAKKALTKEFNDPDNLFPGAADENQRLGREMKQADDEAKKLKDIDPKGAEAATKRAADESIDTPNRKEQSDAAKKDKRRDIGPAGRIAVGAIKQARVSANSVTEDAALRTMIRVVERAMGTLRREAQVVRVANSLDSIRAGLQDAALLKRQLRDRLDKGQQVGLSASGSSGNLL